MAQAQLMNVTGSVSRREYAFLDPQDDDARLENAISRASDALFRMRKPPTLADQPDDYHWAFELEADATIPAEYILLKHFLDEIDVGLEQKIARYLRAGQADHGGWPLFHGGAFEISASVKAYFALKIIGDPIDAPHMVRARQAILAAGGAARCNVFTRIQLALYGEVPWRAVPVMPVEIMHLPRWFPFHLSKISYWSRTVTTPLLVLMALKPRARNPRGVNIQELFVKPPHQEKNWLRPVNDSHWSRVFRRLDNVLRVIEPVFPGRSRSCAIDKAVSFILERLNGEDGLGAIYPAMANTVMMFDSLGFPKDDPDVLIAKQAVEKLLIVNEQDAYCQPCFSPVWDTSLVSHTFAEVGDTGDSNGRDIAERAADWLIRRQILDVKGDWAIQRPDVAPGGWAFQYNNDYYPDLDDTAVVVMALDRLGDEKYQPAIKRAVDWVVGLQSRDGGWGAFDADNTSFHLNCIPFADHGALLDPPTADVTGRCVSMLCQLGYKSDDPAVKRGIDWLLRDQQPDGSWYGRWGTNYIYGTWSVLCALNAAGFDPKAEPVRRAVAWLIAKQREDGGWGESGNSYYPDAALGEADESTPSQTAWGLLGLMAGGAVNSVNVGRGIHYLMQNQDQDGLWQEEAYTAVGFPRVFYLRYHGYPKFFPLWAIARFRNLQRGNATTVMYGM